MSATERAAVTRAMSTGTSALAVPLTDDICKYLVAVMVRDLGLGARFPKVPADVPEFLSTDALQAPPRIPGDFLSLMNALVELDRDTVTYFACLAALHGRRLKYARILQCQPLPTIEQVGPRGLVQFGTLSTRALAALLFWRKWLYDIDNRAAQETGYVFEPVIANAVGGAPFSARKSPVKRSKDRKKGRQVDCIRDKLAYEIKMRVTIAASGQGRWGEELEFPVDARTSGFTPVLIVFDGTKNDKLDALVKAFVANGGQVHVGADAWKHLDAMAGKTMATFLERYVRVPIQSLLDEAPGERTLPTITFKMTEERFTVDVDGDVWDVARDVDPSCAEDEEDDEE